jgi:hypothetical protein
MSAPNTYAKRLGAAHGRREAMIEDEINACRGCGSREFPRRSDCAACIAVVDEYIADEAQK